MTWVCKFFPNQILLVDIFNEVPANFAQWPLALGSCARNSQGAVIPDYLNLTQGFAIECPLRQNRMQTKVLDSRYPWNNDNGMQAGQGG